MDEEEKKRKKKGGEGLTKVLFHQLLRGQLTQPPRHHQSNKVDIALRGTGTG